MRSWWLPLDISTLERVRVQSDLTTSQLAWEQADLLERTLSARAAQDGRGVLLVQLPGTGLTIAMMLLAATGDDISPFPIANYLAG